MGAESKYDAEGKLIEEAKGSCGARFSQAVSAAWKSKPPSEWGKRTCQALLRVTALLGAGVGRAAQSCVLGMSQFDQGLPRTGRVELGIVQHETKIF